jgi:digeranylgeranylglycerophospholipid reductase
MESYDVIVVGAGPAGSTAARFAAEGGARTLLVDRRPDLGFPVQCGEFLPTPGELADLFPARDAIEASYWIPPETVLRRTTQMHCVAPNGRRYSFPLDGVAVSRHAFDQRLAHRAEGAGAELSFPRGVVRVEDDQVLFARGDRASAQVIIGADGPISTVARSAGFAFPREMFRMITASSDGEFEDALSLYFGKFAPGGYAWTIPKDGVANVGLGVNRLPPGGSLSQLLDRFLARERLAPASDRTRWWVPLGPPPASLVRGRSVLVGDAANLVMATNGGGIPTAILSGYDAGVAAARHVRDGTPLAAYDAAWKAHLEAPLARAWEIHRWSDWFARRDRWLSMGMRLIGSGGLDAMMRLRWPGPLGAWNS